MCVMRDYCQGSYYYKRTYYCVIARSVATKQSITLQRDCRAPFGRSQRQCNKTLCVCIGSLLEKPGDVRAQFREMESPGSCRRDSTDQGSSLPAIPRNNPVDQEKFLATLCRAAYTGSRDQIIWLKILPAPSGTTISTDLRNEPCGKGVQRLQKYHNLV